MDYDTALAVHFVVHRVRETASQQPVMTKSLRVDAAVKSQGVNVSEHLIKQ